MIKLKRLNGSDIFINHDLIKFLESTPDTKITFINNDMILVRETIPDILEQIRKYKVEIGNQIQVVTKQEE